MRQKVRGVDGILVMALRFRNVQSASLFCFALCVLFCWFSSSPLERPTADDGAQDFIAPPLFMSDFGLSCIGRAESACDARCSVYKGTNMTPVCAVSSCYELLRRTRNLYQMAEHGHT